MTYLPPDPPLDAPGGGPKVTPASVLAAPRIPVTRWNRRYLLAGSAILASFVAAAFYVGFGGAHKPAAKPPAATPADAAPATSAITDRYAKGYGDPAVQAIGAPGVATLPPPTNPTTAGVGTSPAAVTAPPARPVDPSVQQARDQAWAARSAGPFFAAGAAAPPSGLPDRQDMHRLRRPLPPSEAPPTCSPPTDKPASGSSSRAPGPTTTWRALCVSLRAPGK